MNPPKNENGETEISDIVGLPDLHLVLGAGNDLWKHLETKCKPEMKAIESKLYILKSNYQGKQNFEGNALRKILDNLNLVEENVPQDFHDFVDTLKALREIKLSMFWNNLSYCSPRPNPYFRNVVKFFENKWNHFQQTCNI